MDGSGIAGLVGLSAAAVHAQSPTPIPGDIPSQIEVGPRGSASFTIPIHVAPGIQDLQPNLALNYDSANTANGSVGLGFQLTGLSSISRCGKTLARDGENRGVHLTNGDRLCLDGQALLTYDGVETDEGYWQAHARYRTAEESGARVETLGACTGSPGCSFRVAHPDGSALLYEDVISQGFPQRQWVLRRVRDKHGNEMTLDYLVDRQVAYVREIAYSGRSVVFTYGSRPQGADNEVVFVAGRKEVQRRRLETIEARVNGVTFKSYRLSYNHSPASGHSRLTQVLECDASGSCLDPIALEWYQGARDARFEPRPSPLASLDVTNESLVLGDYNGDGQTDILIQPSGSRSSQAYLYYASGRYFRLFPLAPNNLHADPGAILIPGDYNGDGRTDFVRQERNGWDDDTFDTFSVFFASGEGDGFNRVRTANAHIQTAASFDRGCRFFPGDFNGDGMTDLLRQEHSGWDGDFVNTIQVWMSQGNGEFEIITPGRSVGGDQLQHLLMYDLGMRVIMGDFNGDGLSDFAAHDVNSHNEATHWLRLFFSNGDGTFTMRVPNDGRWQYLMQGRFVNLIPGDYNGDGKTDFLRQEKDDWDDDDVLTFSVHLSMGDGNFEVIEHAASGVDSGVHYDRGVNLISGDFNGDGVDDFIRQERERWARDDTNNSFNVFYARGDGTFFRVTPGGGIYQDDLRATRRDTPNDEGVQLLTGDFDGDGRTDFVTQYLGDPSEGSGVTTRVYYSDPEQRLPDHLVQAIHSGNGLETRLSYAPLSRADVYDARYIAPGQSLRELRGPIWVVAGVTQQAEGQPSTAATRAYRYAGAVLDTSGLGFLGFEEVTIDAPEEGTRVIRHYLGNQTFGGRLAREELRDLASGTLLNERILTWTKISQTPSKIELTRLAEERVRAFEGTADRVTHTSYGYDAFGNTVFERSDDGQGGSVFTCRTFYNDETLQTLHRLLTEEVNLGCTFSNGACSCSGETLSRLELVYDSSSPDGRVVEKRRLDTHQGRWEVERLAYDAHGNVVETVDAAGLKVAMIYDAQLHTYPARRILDPDGVRLESTFVYDPRYGILTEATDPAGGVKIKRLDDFGRLVELGVAGGNQPYEVEERRRYLQQGTLRVVEMTQLEGGRAARVLRMFTDHLGRKVREERDAEVGVVVQAIEWDRAGRMARESELHFAADPIESVGWTTYRYDVQGRVTEVRAPTGLVTSVVYGIGGAECGPAEQRVEIVERDEGGGRRVFLAEIETRTRIECRDTRGKVTRRIFRHGSDRSEQLVQHDALGRVVAAWSQDAAGRAVGSVTEYTYDSLGRRVTTQHSQRGQTEYVFLGNQLQSKTSTAGTVTYAYDTAGRRTRERLPDGTEHRRRYDGSSPFGRGRLTELSFVHASGASGARAYTYDRQGRVVEERVTIDGRDFALGYAYLSDDSVAEVIYPDGSALEVRHDALGNVRELLVDGVSYVSYARHTALGQPVSARFGNGVRTDYAYDYAGRLEQVRTVRDDGVLMDRAYQWNGFDEVSSIRDARHPEHSQTFAYDARGYLVQATGPYGTLAYGYDAAGNLVQKGAVTFTYDGDRPSVSSAGETFTYDARGNRIRKESGLRTTRYTYSSLDQMTEVIRTTCSSTATSPCSEEVVGAFVYDASGARVMKVDASGIVSLYVSPLYEVTIFPDRPELHTKYVPSPSGRVAAISDELAAGSSVGSGASMLGALASRLDGMDPRAGAHALALAFVLASAWFWVRAADPRTRLGRARVRALRVARAIGLVHAEVEARGAAAYGTHFMRSRRRLAAALPTCATYLVLATTGCDVPPTGEMVRVRGGVYGLQRLQNGLLHAARTLQPGENGLGYPVAGTHFFHADHLGSNTLVTDALGDEVAEAFYKPYGEIFQDLSSGQDIFRSKFTGKEWDDGADLFYFEARHYDPYIGRFVQADIMLFGSDGRLASDLNRYAYAANNPVKYTDPSGRFILTSILIGAAIGALVGAASTAIATKRDTGRVDWRAVGISFGIGLITGALAGGAGASAASGLSSLGYVTGSIGKAVVEGAVAGAIGTFSGSAFEQLALEGDVDWGRVGIETLVGTLTGGVLDGAVAKAATAGLRKASQASIRRQAEAKRSDAVLGLLREADGSEDLFARASARYTRIDVDMRAALRDPLRAEAVGFKVPWAAKLDAGELGNKIASGVAFAAARVLGRIVSTGVQVGAQEGILAATP